MRNWNFGRITSSLGKVQCRWREWRAERKVMKFLSQHRRSPMPTATVASATGLAEDVLTPILGGLVQTGRIESASYRGSILPIPGRLAYKLAE
jgi:hypothetical protein